MQTDPTIIKAAETYIKLITAAIPDQVSSYLATTELAAQLRKDPFNLDLNKKKMVVFFSRQEGQVLETIASEKWEQDVANATTSFILQENSKPVKVDTATVTGEWFRKGSMFLKRRAWPSSLEDQPQDTGLYNSWVAVFLNANAEDRQARLGFW